MPPARSSAPSGTTSAACSNAGANFIVIDYIGIKRAGGDLGVMAGQVRRAISWVYRNAASFGADPNRLYTGIIAL